jgi:hypothetical protein
MLVAAILFVSSIIAVFALSVAGNSVRWLFEFLPP